MENAEIRLRAKNFLETTSKVAVATSKENTPWVSSFYYIVDNDFNLYILISKSSKTFDNITNNNKVTCIVEENSDEALKLKYVQIIGSTKEVKKEEIKQVLDNYEIKFAGLIDSTKTEKDFLSKKSDEQFLMIETEKIFFFSSEVGRQELLASSR